MLDRVEPVRVGVRLFEQPVARAQRALQRVDAARMRAVDREHQPVEKAPPLRRGPAEQAVHRRRHPHDAHMIRECRRGRNRLAVDAAFARQRRVLRRAAARCRCRASPSPSAPSSSAATAHEPSPSVNATSSSVARRRPRPGARNEIASIRLVLPAPFGPTSTASCASTVSARRAIAAEIRQREAADAGGASSGSRPAGHADACSGSIRSLRNDGEIGRRGRREIGTNVASSDFNHESRYI